MAKEDRTDFYIVIGMDNVIYVMKLYTPKPIGVFTNTYTHTHTSLSLSLYIYIYISIFTQSLRYKDDVI